MKAKLAIFVFGALVLLANGAYAQHGTGGRTHGRHLSPTLGQAYEYGSRYHYLYLNTDVNRHYKNEVTFNGRYLGADPDPGVRLNLIRDQPDNR
jgi:hypothetical protein